MLADQPRAAESAALSGPRPWFFFLFHSASQPVAGPHQRSLITSSRLFAIQIHPGLPVVAVGAHVVHGVRVDGHVAVLVDALVLHVARLARIAVVGLDHICQDVRPALAQLKALLRIRKDVVEAWEKTAKEERLCENVERKLIQSTIRTQTHQYGLQSRPMGPCEQG